jgi:hypothetical protein
MGEVAKAYFGSEIELHFVMVHWHGSFFLLKRAVDIYDVKTLGIV